MIDESFVDGLGVGMKDHPGRQIIKDGLQSIELLGTIRKNMQLILFGLPLLGLQSNARIDD